LKTANSITEMDRTSEVIHALHAFVADLLYEKPDYHGVIRINLRAGEVINIVKEESIKLIKKSCQQTSSGQPAVSRRT